MKKVILLTALAFALGLSFLVIARNHLVSASSHQLIRRMTGLDFEIEKLDVSLLHSSLEIKGLTLTNPPGYEEPTAFEIAELYADYDLPSLFSDEAHLTELRIDIPTITVVKNEKGETNVDGLRQLSGGDKESTPREPNRRTDKPEEKAERDSKEPSRQAREPEKKMRIDDLQIRIGQVTYIDHSGGGPEPSVFTHNLNVDIHRQDVTDTDEITKAVAGQVFAGALVNLGAFAGLAEHEVRSVDVEKIDAVAHDSMKRVGETLEKLSKDPDSAVHRLLGALTTGTASEEPAGESQPSENMADEDGAEQVRQKSDEMADKIHRDINKLLKGLGGNSSK